MPPPEGPPRRIHYLVPDFEPPSWGVALLYAHVRLLRELGHEANVVHHRTPFRVSYLTDDVPIVYLDDLAQEPGSEELLVAPEVLAAEAARLPWSCRRGVFVQGSFLIVSGLEGAAGYPELGYSFALAVLPHVAEVVAGHFGLEAQVVPPFIAPYFFAEVEGKPEARRERLILLSTKDDYRRAGIPDYDIFMNLIRQKLEGLRGNEGDRAWKLIELNGFRHLEVADLMRRASFLVNLNSHEAFNTTVPEAMASGCTVLCYEAFGGRDFLQDGENAFVFPNHHVFDLSEKLLTLIDEVDGRSPASELQIMRRKARATAARFNEAATRAALALAYSRLDSVALGR